MISKYLYFDGLINQLLGGHCPVGWKTLYAGDIFLQLKKAIDSGSGKKKWKSRLVLEKMDFYVSAGKVDLLNPRTQAYLGLDTSPDKSKWLKYG